MLGNFRVVLGVGLTGWGGPEILEVLHAKGRFYKLCSLFCLDLGLQSGSLASLERVWGFRPVAFRL